MNIRIVVLDERQANFFDATNYDAPLTDRGTLQRASAGATDRDLEADREGRRYGGTSGVTHAGQAMGHHHGVDGERSTEQHDLTLFAKEVAQSIDEGRIKQEFDRVVIVAPPKMLGLLRQSLSAPTESLLIGEVSKDLMHRGLDAVLKAVPREAFSRLH